MNEIKSYGVPGQSTETRTSLDQHAPYVLMNTDRPEPHYICQLVDGVGVWVEPVEDVDNARDRARAVLNPLRDTFLNRLTGIAMFTENKELIDECSSLRLALLDITKDSNFILASTYEEMEHALLGAYKNIALTATENIKNVFRELEAM